MIATICQGRITKNRKKYKIFANQVCKKFRFVSNYRITLKTIKVMAVVLCVVFMRNKRNKTNRLLSAVLYKNNA